MSNEITAYFKGRTGVAESVYQYDYGIVLVLDGIELPATFDCYFNNEGDEEATPAIGADNRVAIPNKCLSVPGNVTAHIPLQEGLNDSEVEYIVTVKVINRAKPVDDGTAEEQTAISKAIAALNHNNLPGLMPDIVNEWLDEHPEATTTVQDESLTYNKLVKGTLGFVMPEMFGAIGDGVTNDYEAFSDCAAYAAENGVSILAPHKEYYLNGDTSIELHSDVECLGSTFIVGNSHFKTYNPLFEYAHDSEIESVSGELSDFFVSNEKVTEDYSDKFFILDTKIAYGTPVSPTAEQNETIKEPIYTSGDDASVLFIDDITSYLSSNVEITNISDMKERGFCFRGAVIKQKTENNFGVCFMRIRRNNMTIKDVQIECNNTQGQGAAFDCRYCCNLTFDNIKSFSEQPDIYTYEIGIYYSANVVVNNFKGFNNWSSIATRGLKNYALLNSITTTFDCHWNAYGRFLCENCNLYGSAHIGYGRGEFIVKDVTCDHINTRSDYVQPWAGRITIENVSTKSGFWLYIPDGTPTGYDSFFNTLILPRIRIVRLQASDRSLYLRVPDSIVSRLGDAPLIIFDSMTFLDVAVPFTNVAYNAVIKSVPFSVGGRSSLKRIANIVYDDNVSDTAELTASSFTSASGQVRKTGNIVTLNFSGILSQSVSAWATIFNIPEGYRPSAESYAVGLLNNTACPIRIGANGNVTPTVALSETNKRFVLAVSYVLSSLY